MRRLTAFPFAAVLAAAAMVLVPIGSADAEGELLGGPEGSRLNGHEPDTYRFGYPYKSSRGTTPYACASQCDSDATCAAWSLTPATFRIGPRCELKRSIGSSERRPGAVSGIASRFHPKAQPVRQTPAPRPRFAPAPSPKPALRPLPPRATSARPLPSVDAMTRTKPRPVVAAPPPQPAPRPQPISSPPPRVDAMTRPVSHRIDPPVQTRPEPGPPPPSVPTHAALEDTGTVQIYPPPPPIQPRKPWTDRTQDDVTYSVEDMDFIPGDEEATAGYLDGAPDN